jgi:S-adenosylmethionine decarboxylase
MSGRRSGPDLRRHLLLEFHGCDPALLGDPARLAEACRNDEPAAAVMPDGRFHVFQPQGLSGAVISGGTVFTVHTWPEQGFATIDLFSRQGLDAEVWGIHLSGMLQAERWTAVGAD